MAQPGGPQQKQGNRQQPQGDGKGQPFLAGGKEIPAQDQHHPGPIAVRRVPEAPPAALARRAAAADRAPDLVTDGAGDIGEWYRGVVTTNTSPRVILVGRDMTILEADVPATDAEIRAAIESHL